MDTISDIRIELAGRRGDWRAICDATGLSYWWLAKVSQGTIGEPGVSKVQRLLAYFAEHPREPAAPPPSATHPTAASPAGVA